MKRILRTGLYIFLAFLMPAGIVYGQEKKNEQRVKIVVADKDGTKVTLDTLINEDQASDSIILKDGKVIYFTGHGTAGGVQHIKGGEGHMFVTVTSDDKDNQKIKKEITIISGDSMKVLHSGAGENVIIIKDGKHFVEGKGGKVFTWSSSESGSDGESVIYIDKGKIDKKVGEKSINVNVKTDENGNTLEKTKYVIAKDGMVVSVEGNDETRVKEMISVIESKLGVTKEDKSAKQVVKDETKKTTKK